VDPSAFGVGTSKLQVSAADIEIDTTKPLGEGTFGVVYAGRLRGKLRVAVKTLKGVDARAVSLFAREVRNWEGLVQRNVMPLMAFCLDPPMMVCEIADGGNMRQFLEARGWEQGAGRRFLFEVGRRLRGVSSSWKSSI
jgi:serine/threonine protein kinase